MFKEYLKQFFGSTKGGILLRIFTGVVVFCIITFLQSSSWGKVEDYTAYGWPMVFRETWDICYEGDICSTFAPLSLAVDVVVGYLASCLGTFLILASVKAKNSNME